MKTVNPNFIVMKLLIKVILVVSSITGIVPSQNYDFDGIRDGVLYLRSNEKNYIRLSWKDIWEADGHEETIYFQAPDGTLIKRLIINENIKNRYCTLSTDQLKGDYRLEIPGMSYREYSVNVSNNVPSVFEPVKLHFSINNSKAGTEYYFKTSKKKFTVCAKSYSDNITTIQIISPDKIITDLILEKKNNYTEYSKKTFNVENTDGFWSVRIPGNGKISFWIDNTENYFATDSSMWFIPEYKNGTVSVKIDSTIKGKAPKIGGTLPEKNIPENAFPHLAKLHLNYGHYYAFYEKVKEHSDFKKVKIADWCLTYNNRLKINEHHSLFALTANTSFQTIQKKDEISLLTNKIAATNYERTNEKVSGTIAFFDEPNTMFKTNEEYVANQSLIIKNVKKDYKDIKILIPESAGFLNGPTKIGSINKLGIDWARALLKTDKNGIEGVSWHEWNVRDLIATEWYKKNIDSAKALLTEFYKVDAVKKKIIISQTNISSGDDFSPYENDTFFAALWFTSVIINCGVTGVVDAICWFPTVDERHYHKGLIEYRDGKVVRIRPVGTAIKFVNEDMLPKVLNSVSSSIDFEVLASTDSNLKKITLIMVNKSKRIQDVSIRLTIPQALKKKPLKIDYQTFNSEGMQSGTQLKPVIENNYMNVTFTSSGECISKLIISHDT